MSERVQFSKEVSFGNILSILTILTATVTVTWRVGDINTKADVNSAKVYATDVRLTSEIADRKQDRTETLEQLKTIDGKLQALLIMQTEVPRK